MPDFAMVPVANLLVDEQNPRLSQPSSGQREAIRALAETQGRKLQALARDIVDNGLDPSDLIIVMPFGRDAGRYAVLDGNRRLTALRALENPELLVDVVPKTVLGVMRRLAAQYQGSSIHEVQCVVFETRDEANHWIELRNAGEAGGAGPVQWGSDEKDRFRARNGGKPNLATQVLDFLENRGDITHEQRRDTAATTLTRILGSPDIRPKLGLEQSNGALFAIGDLDEVAKAVTYIVAEISDRRLDVTQVYTKQQRTEFANRFPVEFTVNRTKEPGSGSLLQTVPNPEIETQIRDLRQQDPPRSRLIPDDCALNVTDPRTHDIERELRALSLSRNPNAVAILFRVFIELSVDSYITREGVAVPDRAILHTRLNKTADHLLQRQKITRAQAAPVRRNASPDSFLGPSVPLMHQWVHNQHLSPVASELRSHWNDLQPFLAALWAQ